MKRLAHPSLSRALGTTASISAVAVLVACQQILNISDRPLIPPDAGVDGGGGEDSGAQQDSGAADAPVDTGAGDASDASALDATAVEASAVDASAIDAGPLDSGYSLTAPFQVNISSFFNANSVATTAGSTGQPLTPMDGQDLAQGDDDDFATAAEIEALSCSPGAGLPNNGLFATNGATIPSVQLAWSDASNTLNSLVVLNLQPTNYTLNLPPLPYSQIQLYATGTGGESTLEYTLTYSDSTTYQGEMVLPDWCKPPPTLPAGVFILASVDRVQNNGTACNANNSSFECNIYAVDLSPAPGKSVASVMFSDTGSTSTSYFVFYGATAW